MTKNELATFKQSTFSYDFQPAVLLIHKYEQLLETARAVAEHYNSIVFEEGDIQGINQAHRELNSWIKQLDEGRKNVKRDYNKPLEEFEKEIKQLIEILKEPLNRFKEERDKIEDAERAERQKALDDYLERQLKKEELERNDIEEDPRWLNKGNWTERLNPRKPLKDKIKHEIERAKEEQKVKLSERKVLQKFFKDREEVAPYYMKQFENGRSSAEIMEEVLSAEDKKEPTAKVNIVTEPIEEKEEEAIDETAVNISSLLTDMKLNFTLELEMTIEQANELEEFMHEKGIKVKSYERDI